MHNQQQQIQLQMQRQMEQQQLLVERLLSPQQSSSSSVSQPAATPAIRDCELPKIHIKPFGGDYKEWHAFKDLFESTIHGKTTLTNIQKFHHLKSCVIGEAAILIQHLPVVDANYEVAWKSLSDRYEKPRYLVNLLMDTFTALPKAVKQNSSSLRALTCGASDVIYLLINKVDETTRREWIDKSQDIENPTIEELLKFLDSRCDRLELSQVVDHVASKPRDEKGKRQARTMLAITGNCMKSHSTEHILSVCPQFQSLTIKQRYTFAKEKHMCFNCLKTGHGVSACGSKSSCKYCKRRHHSLLHSEGYSTQHKSAEQHQGNSGQASEDAPAASAVAMMNVTRPSKPNGQRRSTLPTALVHVRNSQGALLTVLATSGISDVKAGITRGFCSLQMMSRVSSHCIDINAHVLGKITSPLARENIDASSLSVFNGYRMADPDFRTNASIDILLGNEYIWLVLTIFGWVITSVYVKNATTIYVIADYGQYRWTTAKILGTRGNSITYNCNEEDEKVETHNRNSNGRYIVNLPFKEQNPQFADTFQGARSRFLAVERRLMKDASLKLKYTQFMREYIQLGHMKEEVADEATNVCKMSFYLPHHPVTGAKLRDGRSLNDALHIGTCIQRNLFNTSVTPEHQDFQRILWREDPEDPLKHYKLTTVTYGTACAPFLAIRVLEQLAADHEYEFPRAARILLDDFYVDDVLTGAMNEQELLDIKEELVLLMPRAQLELSKWVSNSKRIASNERNEIDFSRMTAKVLGLHWRPGEDVLTYKVSLSEHMTYTKRQVLSDTARIFDPLGILAPVVIKFKILLQELWLLNLDWDSEPTKQAHLWQKFRKDIFTLRILKIPRFVDNQPDDIELHGFSDASLKAYSAVIYNRVTHLDGSIGVALIAAKTRVSPLKQKSLPRQRHHTTHQRQAFPFEYTGCDYAGPILLKVHKGRNPRKEKGYICLFVCMVTSALHLELATDLSTDTFLVALKRFMARRGKCSQMYSDNGRNFVGAKRALDEMLQLLASREHNDVVLKALADQGIKWNFIPPYSPHWGGKCELAVRSVKLHLRRVIGTNVLTFEQMHTLLSQIESVVNSRPLCTASDTEIAYLSPAHFLIGRTYTAVPEDGYLQIPTNRLSYWQHVQAMLQGFWKRWHQEYLTLLQQRPKWTTKLPNITIGNVVLIKDRSAWLLGRVTQVFSGDDGLVRAVQVLTKSGEVTRPITRIAALPGSETEFQGGGGRDVEEPIVTHCYRQQSKVS
ncbi:uncharacterized protein [Drosophila tropicalis]|uniref:uncharacterized protein n=1 Tax=Drosophila tropicalis TaxID=46794 RepID=UPI0035AC0AE6